MSRRSNKNSPHGVAPVVERNIKTLLERRRKEEEALGFQEKLAGAISRFAGSMTFLLLHAVVLGLWVVINFGWIPGIPRFDPTLVRLGTAVSVEAIFLSTFILITQRHMMAEADRRGDLHLQISLLAEYEVTRLITMTREIARSMDIKEGDEPELEELAQDVAPEELLETMAQHERKMREGEEGTD